MIPLAVDGITSLSVKPIRIITVLGVVFAAIFFISLIIASIRGNELWAAGNIINLLLSIVLLSVGVIGEYVGKTYMESKHRPRYIISERTY